MDREEVELDRADEEAEESSDNRLFDGAKSCVSTDVGVDDAWVVGVCAWWEVFTFMRSAGDATVALSWELCSKMEADVKGEGADGPGSSIVCVCERLSFQPTRFCFFLGGSF